MAQDDYYYEIQLSNKQLVFYFMAGATGLILSFLAGVMVGRGVDAGSGEVQASRPPQEERVVTEEPPRPAPPSAEQLTYAQRLEGDKVDERLEKPKPAGEAPAKAVSAPAEPVRPPVRSPAAHTPEPARSAAAVPVKPSPSPVASPRLKPSPPLAPPTAVSAPAPALPVHGPFAIQVGAFKDQASADAVMGQLKKKGFPAYVISPASPEGLFNVRVGTFPGRPEAEKVQSRLRDEEKLKPFIVRN